MGFLAQATNREVELLMHLFQVQAHPVAHLHVLEMFRSGAYPGKASSQTAPRVSATNSLTSARRWVGEYGLKITPTSRRAWNAYMTRLVEQLADGYRSMAETTAVETHAAIHR